MKLLTTILILCLFVASCTAVSPGSTNNQPTITQELIKEDFPSRPSYQPGELVEYIAQTGDSLESIAVHFNTTIDEIRKVNPGIPTDGTTMPPGMPMKIPIYFLPYWGSQYKIIPDFLFINGPSVVDFDTFSFVSLFPGWLKNYSSYAGELIRSGSEIIDLVSLNFSISPRVFLTLLEYKASALTDSRMPATEYILGYQDNSHKGLYLQLVWAANELNNGYYGWRSGHIKTFELPDGSLERPDPWQNAASVAFQYLFHKEKREVYDFSIGSEGFSRTFSNLFGDPWNEVQYPHIPVSLVQPNFLFPFSAGESWTFTGGPHSGWGTLEPYSGLDFAPPANIGGCEPTELWATAIHDGVIARSETGVIILDIDGDGDERTGWNILYLHVGTEGRLSKGDFVSAGGKIGHPSCEGGRTTGTHIHIARKYNGEWIPADGVLGFNLEGWIAHDGERPYLGTLSRGNNIVTACDCSNIASRVTAGN